ncbi:MAG: TIGR03560 family F420-dependent LLM class oxidoreductase [Candidatus Lambdaproteobacteria bacterium]|nr:TIGR03560 family F420-dependent LLM class oxidoreductase [Candidatus Lambdaproteobacteria bacterium]
MTLKLGLHIGPQDISMDDLKRLWLRADEGGLHWVSVWDHFYANPLKSRENPCFEGIAAMAALAAMTRHVRVGCLVFCALFRSPGLLAKAAATIDHISNGRLELGIGAGWFKEEFEEFGYAFPPLPERMDQLEEALQIVRGLFHEPSVTFQGKYYRLEGAVCAPKPVQRPPRIWVGGQGGRRTPRMAARYGDGFNVPYLSPEQVRARNQRVDEEAERLGRDPAAIVRSANLGFFMGADARSAERNTARMRQLGHSAMGEEGNVFGTPQQVIDRIAQYEQAGVQGVNIAIRPPVDWDAFEAYIEQVLPAFKG